MQAEAKLRKAQIEAKLMQDQQDEEKAVAELRQKIWQREALIKLAIAEAECAIYNQAIDSSGRSLYGSTLCQQVATGHLHTNWCGSKIFVGTIIFSKAHPQLLSGIRAQPQIEKPHKLLLICIQVYETITVKLCLW